MGKSRITSLRSKKYNENITKRGLVPGGVANKEESQSPVSPLLLGFLLFVLVGSSIFQMLRSAKAGPVF